MRIRIGTRATAMAQAQARCAAERLKAAHASLEVEIVTFTPAGDRDQVSRLDRHGGKGGAFVSEIRDAIRTCRIECALHSLKDMPGDEEAPGLVIGAYLLRDAVEDVLVLRKEVDATQALADELAGLKIGTNSVRRAAFLKRLYPQAELIHFRGAVDTRLRKLDRRTPQKLPDGGETDPADGLILAAAGLARIDAEQRIVRVFSTDEMPPAVGQGTLTLECRRDDFETQRLLAGIDDSTSRAVSLAEREVLWVLNGHCNTPIAGHARLRDGHLDLYAAVLNADGSEIIETRRQGPAERPRELGRVAGLDLLTKGARRLIEASRL
jgi:hydroxymethylbilane synthase